MQSSDSGKAQRWSRFEAEQSLLVQATATVGRLRSESATTLRASVDCGEVAYIHPASHLTADNRQLHYEASHPKTLIKWEHARWRYGVAPYQGVDMRRALTRANAPKVVIVTIQGKRIKLTERIERKLDTGAENMVANASQEVREQRAKQAKYQAMWSEYASTTHKPDGHSRWCGCHRCNMVKAIRKHAA